MIILQDAWKAAQQFLDREVRPHHRAELVIMAVHDHPKAWAFGYTTRAFVQDGDLTTSLVGNGPVVVPKSGRKIFLGSSAEPISAQLDRLEEQ